MKTILFILSFVSILCSAQTIQERIDSISNILEKETVHEKRLEGMLQLLKKGGSVTVRVKLSKNKKTKIY